MSDCITQATDTDNSRLLSVTEALFQMLTVDRLYKPNSISFTLYVNIIKTESSKLFLMASDSHFVYV